MTQAQRFYWRTAHHIVRVYRRGGIPALASWLDNCDGSTQPEMALRLVAYVAGRKFKPATEDQLKPGVYVIAHVPMRLSIARPPYTTSDGRRVVDGYDCSLDDWQVEIGECELIPSPYQ